MNGPLAAGLDSTVLARLRQPVTPVEAAPRRVLREACYEAGAQAAHLAGARF